MPGSTIETLKTDLQFFFDRKIYAKIHPAQVLTNSPMAHKDYIEKFAIEVDAEDHVISTYSYTREDAAVMKKLRYLYMLSCGFCVLKYVLCYVNVDCGIKATEFLHQLQLDLDVNPHYSPTIIRILEAFSSVQDEMPYESVLRHVGVTQWDDFYREIGDFAFRAFGIDDIGFRVVRQLQAALMPGVDRVLPASIRLQHDVVSYFQHIYADDNVNVSAPGHCPRLDSFGPVEFEVSDPHNYCNPASDDWMNYDVRGIDWELASPLLQFDVVGHSFASS